MTEKKYNEVLIESTLWQDITEYATLNELNPTELANKLLKERFMVEKYGVSPFKKIDMVEVPEPIQEVINDHFDEMLGFEPVPVEESEKMITELLSNNVAPELTKEQKEETDRMIKEDIEMINANTEVENKPKKRRLKK